MRIMIITTSRADWNGLGMVTQALRARDHEVLIVAAGHGPESVRVVMAEEPTTRWIVVSAADKWAPERASTILRGVALYLQSDTPDLVVLLGDRYETLAAAQGALLSRTPIAHLDGGDLTLGSWDDAIRHALTKLSHIHFPCCADSFKRIVQMGESPDRVHNVGSTHVDRVMRTPRLGLVETLEEINLSGSQRFVLVNWQPETLADNPNGGLRAILAAIPGLPADIGVLFVGPGADLGGQEAVGLIRDHGLCGDRAVAYDKNLKPAVYLSVLSHCQYMIGNSSSAHFEAPLLGTMAIEVGDRQKGRWRLGNVVDCTPERLPELLLTGGEMLSKRQEPRTMYGDGTAALQIAEVLCKTDPKSLLRKEFYRP